MRQLVVLSFVLLGFVLTADSGAQQSTLCRNWDAEFSPQPATEGAALSVRVFGTWPTSAGGTMLTAFSISGSDLIVELEGPATGGPAAVSPFSRSIAIGRLSQGTYHILIEATLDPGMPNERNLTCDPIPAQVLSASAIPSASSVSLVLLGTLLALYGVRRLG